MICSYRQLNSVERRKIDDLLARRFRVDDIAREPGRHLSTIYREIETSKNPGSNT